MTAQAESSPVLVTGGTGQLGRAVVAELGSRGIPVRVLSRSAGIIEGAQTVSGNLATGAGLEAAAHGIRAVVHCASDPKRGRAVDVDGSRRLLAVLGTHAPAAHVVYVSIVGCDKTELGYYRIKAECERVIAASTVPHSIVRATQFHELVATIARGASRGPIAFSVREVSFQPCAIHLVATQLVDVALGEPLPGPRALAGPQRLTLSAAIRAVAAQAGRRPPTVLSFPAIGSVLRSLGHGSNLPGGDAVIGGETFSQWLARPSPHHRAESSEPGLA